MSLKKSAYSFYAYMRERGIFGIRFSRIGAVTVITCVVLLFSMILTMVLTTQLSQFSKKFPSYWNSFSEAVIKSNDALMKRNIELKEIFDFIPFLERKGDKENPSEPPALTQETVPALPAPDGAADPDGETENGDESLLPDDGVPPKAKSFPFVSAANKKPRLCPKRSMFTPAPPPLPPPKRPKAPAPIPAPAVAAATRNPSPSCRLPT